MGVRILGTGSYLPPKVLSNDEIAKALDTSDEWIYSHTGIHSRHIAGEGESASTMGAQAARAAMEMAGVAPEDIGLILVACSTGDYAPFPSVACLIQAQLALHDAGACDLVAACSGFVYALEQARGYLLMHPDRKVLVVGAECLSRIIDWTDRTSCILFGDGAGAVVLGNDTPAGEPVVNAHTHTILGADGARGACLVREGGGRVAPKFSALGVPQTDGCPHGGPLLMSGHDVFAFAVRTLAHTTEQLCEKEGIVPASLDRVFAHQANRRIIEATARRMKLPLEKFWINLETTANTSAASIPISLDQAVRAGELKDGMRIVMVGFGAGLTFGGTYCVWPSL